MTAEVHLNATVLSETFTRTGHWGGVYAMTLCVFALIASEFMPVSLLTPLANDLQVSQGLAGQGLAISGAFAVLASLSISWIAGTLNRKTLLLALTGLMAVSGDTVALPELPDLHGWASPDRRRDWRIWSMSAATAMRLVPAAQVPKALAVFERQRLGYGSGSATGQLFGLGCGLAWCVLCLVPVALIALVWQWISLPSMAAQKRSPGAGNVFKLLKNRKVALGMAAAGLFFMGQFTLFTYLPRFWKQSPRSTCRFFLCCYW